MRTIIAAAILMVAGVAMGQAECPLCSPGTTPSTYQITFAGTSDAELNNKTFVMLYIGGNVWRSEWRKSPTTPAEAAAFDYTYGAPQQGIPGGILTFYHAGYNPTNQKFAGRPSQGFVSPNVAGVSRLDGGRDIAGFTATTGERNGNGPFVIPLSIGGTATVQP